MMLILTAISIASLIVTACVSTRAAALSDWGPDAKDPAPASSVIPLVLFSSARSGSNFLCQVLNTHPEILMHYEVFHEDDQGNAYVQYRDDPLISRLLSSRKDNPGSFLDALFANSHGYKVVGFKIFHGHLKNSLVLSDIIQKSRPGIKFIVLKRKNMLAKYVSNLKARKTNTWGKKEDGTRIQGTGSIGNSSDEPKSISIDTDEFLHYIKRETEWYRLVESGLNRSGITYLQIEYNDIHVKWYEIQRFIGISEHPFKQPKGKAYVKQSKMPLRDQIKNYSQWLKTLPSWVKACCLE